MLHMLEIGIELLQPVAVAHEHEDLIEQMLERRLIEQRLDVRALVMRRHEHRSIDMRTQWIGGVSGDRDDLALPLAKLTTKMIESAVLSVLGKHHHHMAALGARDVRRHQHGICVPSTFCVAYSGISMTAVLPDASCRGLPFAVSTSSSCRS